MRRRDLILFLGGLAAAWPAVAHAQRTEIRRIGVLMTVAAESQSGRDRVTGFLQALRERGWTEGLNVKIDFRWTDNPELLRQYAAELVALAPDVILASGLALAPLQQATRTVPIVFTGTANPVGL